MTMQEQAGENKPQANIHERVSAQFGAAAAAYTQSLAHRDPSALSKVVELARPLPGDHALDIATGAGHTALALAPYVASVIAYDMTEAMLAETRKNAAAAGIANLSTVQGIAEALPFPDQTFDVVTVRHAPHHFSDVRAAVREMGRVAKAGARIVIVDSVSPDDEEVARSWDYMERLRDPSHVRNYSLQEWRGFLADARLRVITEDVSFVTEQGGRMDFVAWVRRINSSPAAARELEHLFREASPKLAAALRIQIVDGAIFFCVPQITIAAVKE